MEKANMKKSLAPVGIMLLSIVLFLLVILDLDTDGKTTQKTESTVAMGTVISEKIYGADNDDEIFDSINSAVTELENEISMRIGGSAVDELNSESYVQVSDELSEVFEKCNKVYKNSNGAFDITVGKLTSLWKIGEDGANVPSEKQIKKALLSVDGNAVKVTNDKVSIADGQLVDLGAVGKGLACDKVRKVLDESEVKSAVISIGGSVLLYGENPTADKWSVAIRDPRGESSDYIGKLSLDSTVVSTSGDYERVLEKDGKKYHHIIDPKTGYPADSGLMSVTVVCDDGLLSDALSTAAFIMGLDGGKKLLEKYGAEGVFVDTEKNVYVTSGLREKFELTNGDYSVSGDWQ